MSGNPVASVSRPMVICGSSRRSLENPLPRNPSYPATRRSQDGENRSADAPYTAETDFQMDRISWRRFRIAAAVVPDGLGR